MKRHTTKGAKARKEYESELRDKLSELFTTQDKVKELEADIITIKSKIYDIKWAHVKARHKEDIKQ